MTIEDANVGQIHGVVILALKKATGSMTFNRDASTKLEAGDMLIAIGERSQLKRISKEPNTQAARA